MKMRAAKAAAPGAADNYQVLMTSVAEPQGQYTQQPQGAYPQNEVNGEV
jgi:hypothetical protein